MASDEFQKASVGIFSYATGDTKDRTIIQSEIPDRYCPGI